MEPCELEFIGENQTIGIIPNFTLDNAIHLISGSIGPFRAGLPVHGKYFRHVNKFCSRIANYRRKRKKIHSKMFT